MRKVLADIDRNLRVHKLRENVEEGRKQLLSLETAESLKLNLLGVNVDNLCKHEKPSETTEDVIAAALLILGVDEGRSRVWEIHTTFF